MAFVALGSEKWETPILGYQQKTENNCMSKSNYSAFKNGPYSKRFFTILYVLD